MTTREYVVHLWKVNRPFMSRTECVKIILERLETSREIIKDALTKEGIWY